VRECCERVGVAGSSEENGGYLCVGTVRSSYMLYIAGRGGTAIGGAIDGMEL
jgi:hypothetical protein